MNKKDRIYLRLLVLTIISIIMIMLIPNYCQAEKIMQDEVGGGTITTPSSSSSGSSNPGNPIINPDDYAPGGFSTDEANLVMSKAGVVFNTITTVGIIISVITILIIGIKYIVGSVEEKAEYKKTMIPYIVGVFMIMSISAILKLIASLTANFF